MGSKLGHPQPGTNMGQSWPPLVGANLRRPIWDIFGSQSRSKSLQPHLGVNRGAPSGSQFGVPHLGAIFGCPIWEPNMGLPSGSQLGGAPSGGQSDEPSSGSQSLVLPSGSQFGSPHLGANLRRQIWEPICAAPSRSQSMLLHLGHPI